jgi:hypothetical protein
VCTGALSSLLDVLFVGELVVIGTEDFHRADITFETDLLEGIGKSLVRQAVTGLIGPQALLIGVVLGAAGNVLNAVQVPDEDSLAIGLLEGLERRSQAVEVILVKSDTNVRRTDFLDDCESVLETVDGHCRLADELDGKLDSVRVAFLDHLAKNFDCILADVIDGGLAPLDVHGRNYDDHLALQLVADIDDLVQLCHNGVLLLLGLLHVEEYQSVVGEHLQVVLGISKPCSEIIDGVLAGSNLSVQALGLDVDKIYAVLLAKVKVFKNRMVLTETVAAFIKTDLHGISPFISYFCNDSDAFL